MMKPIWTTGALLLFVLTSEVEAATYYSRASGAWNAATTWSLLGHAGPATILYPGQFLPGDVAIISGHTVTLTATPPQAIGAIIINHGNAVATPTKLDLNTAGTTLTCTGLTITESNLLTDIDVEVSTSAILQVNGAISITRGNTNSTGRRMRLYARNTGRINCTGNFTYAYGRSGGEAHEEILLDNGARLDVGGNLLCSIGFSGGANDQFLLRMNNTASVNVTGTSTLCVLANNDGDDFMLDLNGGTFTSNGLMTLLVPATASGSSRFDAEWDGAAVNANGGLTCDQQGGNIFNLLLNANSTVSPASLVCGGNLTCNHNQGASDFSFQTNANSSVSVSGNMPITVTDNALDGFYFDLNGGVWNITGNITGAVNGPGTQQRLFWTLDGSSTMNVGGNVSVTQTSGGPFTLFLNRSFGSNAGLTVGNDFIVNHAAGAGRVEIDMDAQSDLSVGRDLSITAAFGANNEFAWIGLRNSNTFSVGRDLLLTMTAGTDPVNDLTLRQWSGSTSIGRHAIFTKSAGDEAYWNQDGGTSTVGGDLRFVSSGGDDCWLYLDNASSLGITGDLSFAMTGGDQARVYMNEVSGSGAILNIGDDLLINMTANCGDSYIYQNTNTWINVAGDVDWSHAAGNDLSRWRMMNNARFTVGGYMACAITAGAGTTDDLTLDLWSGANTIGADFTLNKAGGDDNTLDLRNGSTLTIGGDLNWAMTGGDAGFIYVSESGGGGCVIDVGDDATITKSASAGDMTILQNTNSRFDIAGDMTWSHTANDRASRWRLTNNAAFSIGGFLLCQQLAGAGTADDFTLDFWSGANTLGSDFTFTKAAGDDNTLDLRGTSTLLVPGNFLWSMSGGDAGYIYLNESGGNGSAINVTGHMTISKGAVGGDMTMLQNTNSRVNVGGNLTWTHVAANDAARWRLTNDAAFSIGGALNCEMTAGAGTTDDFTLDVWSGTNTIGSEFGFTKANGDDHTLDVRGSNTSITLPGDMNFAMTGGDAGYIYLNESGGSGALLSVGGDLNISKTGTSGAITILQNSTSSIQVGDDLNWLHTADDDQSRHRLTNNTNSLTVGEDMTISLVNGAGTTDDMVLDWWGGTVSIGGDLLWQHADGDDFTATVNNQCNVTVGGNLTLDHAAGDDQLLDINNNNTYVHVQGHVLLSDGAGGSTTTTWRMDNSSRARILGDFSMTATAGGEVLFDMNNTSYMWLKGSLVRSAAPNHFGTIDASGNSTIEFNGTANTQVITDDTGNGGDYARYENVVVNNTFGSYPQLSTEGTTTIWRSIQFLEGVLNTATTRKLVIADGTTCNQGDANSFVDGPMRRIGGSDFVFPVGDNGYWARLAMINMNQAANNTEFDCEYLASGAPNNSAAFYAPGVNHVSFVEHWVLNRAFDTGNNATSQVRLYWESAPRSVITYNADLRVAGYRTSGSLWYNHDGTGVGGATGSILSTTAISEFGPVTFASALGINPLPVEMLSFAGQYVGPDVHLAWSTASEQENLGFQVQRTRDGLTWFTIGFVQGQGNSSTVTEYAFIDADPLPGTSYYRLEQQDADGSVDHSDVIALSAAGTTDPAQPVLFPNPGNGDAHLLLAVTTGEEATIEVIDAVGRTLLMERAALRVQQPHLLATGALPVGAYVVQVTFADGTLSTARWVKQ